MQQIFHLWSVFNITHFEIGLNYWWALFKAAGTSVSTNHNESSVHPLVRWVNKLAVQYTGTRAHKNMRTSFNYYRTPTQSAQNETLLIGYPLAFGFVIGVILVNTHVK